MKKRRRKSNWRMFLTVEERNVVKNYERARDELRKLNPAYRRAVQYAMKRALYEDDKN